MKTVSAADANRHFSKILREVQDGATVTITSRGKPVAVIAPSAKDDAAETRRAAAWQALMDRLNSQPALNIPVTWARDDIYDDDF